MNLLHQQTFQREMASARHLIRERKHDEAFAHLERAHVLGQERVRWHVLSHWHMLRVAFQRHEPSAVLGQAVRIVLGALGSAIGSIPTGNTGGTNVSMFKRMPIAPELLSIMQGRARDIPIKVDGTGGT